MLGEAEPCRVRLSRCNMHRPGVSPRDHPCGKLEGDASARRKPSNGYEKGRRRVLDAASDRGQSMPLATPDVNSASARGDSSQFALLFDRSSAVSPPLSGGPQRSRTALRRTPQDHVARRSGDRPGAPGRRGCRLDGERERSVQPSRCFGFPRPRTSASLSSAASSRPLDVPFRTSSTRSSSRSERPSPHTKRTTL